MRRQIVLFLSALFSLAAASFAGEPLMINQILIDPKDPKILYAAARPEGFLKSVDRGKSWSPARAGVKNTSGYHLAMDPRNPSILYLATFGGGVYKSVNGGDAWIEINDGVGNTNIHAMAIDPNDPQKVVVDTSTAELFASEDGGGHWAPFGQGLPSIDEGEIIATLLFDPTRSRLYLGQVGLYMREKSGPWISLGDGLTKEWITALAIDPVNRLFYAGTKMDGLFVSRDEGKSWKPPGAELRKQWINKIFIGRSKELYMSVYAKGFFRSSDQGGTWRKVEGGLPSDDEVMSLAIDPEDSNRLYAGTHNKGIYISTDGGTTWSAPEIKQEPVQAIINSLVPDETSAAEKAPNIPAAFTKCTKCHGWGDLSLTRKKTFWRVPPNKRDWRPTVKRMAPGAGLTPPEEEIVIQFLNNYSRARRP